MFVGYQVFGYLADRIGSRAALILNFIGAAITVPIYASQRDLAVLFWMGPLMACFFSYAGVFGSYFPRLYPLHIRSLGSGFCFDVGRGISALAPVLLGFIASQYSLSIGIALCGASFACAGLTMLFLPREERRDAQLGPDITAAVSDGETILESSSCWRSGSDICYPLRASERRHRNDNASRRKRPAKP
eukprot:gene22327-23453_t